MAAYFFDTSGIAKRYVVETGSTWVKGAADSTTGNRLYVAAITEVEVAASLTRRVRGGSLSASEAVSGISDFQTDLRAQYRILDISPTLIDAAVNVAMKHGLRGYDAVQLAAVLQVRDERVALGATPIILVSADTELNTAALAEGLLVEDPNNHP